MATEKKNKTAKHLLFIFFLVLGVLAGVFIEKIGDAFSITIGAVFYLPIFFVPILVLVIGIHELGHAIAGILVKFDFRTYVIGPFLFNKETTGWKFKWNTNINTAGGLVICLPTSATDNINRKFAWYAAGGPLASLILAILTFALTYFLDNNTSASANIKFLLMIIGIFSFIIMIATAIPYYANGLASDGARFISMLKGGDRAKFEGLILKVMASATSGIRPKLLPIKDLEEAKILGDKLNAPFKIYLPSFYHQIAFDNNDFESAEKYLFEHISYVDKMPKGINSSVWVDAAFFYAFAKKDIKKATAYWSKFTPSAMTQKAQMFATEAAIALLKEEYNLARTKIEVAYRELPNMIDKGLAIALREKLEKLETKIHLVT